MVSLYLTFGSISGCSRFMTSVFQMPQLYRALLRSRLKHACQVHGSVGMGQPSLAGNLATVHARGVESGDMPIDLHREQLAEL